MRINRTLLSIALVVVALVVQVSVLARLQLPGAVPDLLLLTVLGLAFVYGPVSGSLIGFGAGLLADLAPPPTTPPGATPWCSRGDPAGPGRPVALPALRPGRPLGHRAHLRQGAARQGGRHPLRGRQPRPRHGQGENDPAVSGSTLITHLDARVQAVAEYELAQAMKKVRDETDKITGRKYEADSGAVVVMESKTGRVISMASQPDYDPNDWVGGISGKQYAKLTSKKSNYPLLNRGIQGRHRRLHLQGGLRERGRAGRPRLQRPLPFQQLLQPRQPDLRELRVPGTEPPITLGDALKYSCNTVFYRLGHEEWVRDGGIKPKKDAKNWFYTTARDFGLGAETGIDLPNEVKGRIPGPQVEAGLLEGEQGRLVQGGQEGRHLRAADRVRGLLEGNQLKAYDSINYAIGQGDVLVTPIQMATYAAISNGGTLHAPTVGKAVISPDGKTVQEIKPKVTGKLPVNAQTIKDLDKGLRSVVEPGGTAAWRFGGWPQDKIPMRAKTGTAQVYGKQTTSWFATYTDDYTIIMTISRAAPAPAPPGPPSARSTTRSTASTPRATRM
ncbi:Peptidoglycan D,D-transpeptidase MrdA [Streptomyces microflavus]